MLDLRAAARQARERIRARLAAAEKQKNGLPRSAAVIQTGASFRMHLMEALRRGGDERKSPSPAPSAFFLAFPEKLFGKWFHLAFGSQRLASEAAPEPTSDGEAWRSWDALGVETKVTNFAGTQPRAVLLAHGLSAIEDSTLLLADIGRASRAARVLEVPLRILLADVSWISYNRSLRRFDLDDKTIETGLRLCQDRRQRLYYGIGAEVKVHEIVPYQKRGSISSQKINLIASQYLNLATYIWGADKVETAEPLGNPEVTAIGRSLQSSMGNESPLQFLAGFPGAIPALERALGPHLNVVRNLAQKFRMLSRDTFSYYFAQYYAQDEYRSTHVKVAPVSERDFDEPFDELDESLRSWGEGHVSTVESTKPKQVRRKRLAAVYLPQYRLGDWTILPYSPLSLAALSKSGGSINAVREHIVLTSDLSLTQQPKVESILRLTCEKAHTIHLNRLIADLISYLQAVVLARRKGIVETLFRQLGCEFDQTLSELHPDLPKFFAIECEDGAVIADLWLSWLDAIDERESELDYTPCHLLVSSFTREDWNDRRFRAASLIALGVNLITHELWD